MLYNTLACTDRPRPERGKKWVVSLGRTGFRNSPVMEGFLSECSNIILQPYSESDSSWWKFFLVHHRGGRTIEVR